MITVKKRHLLQCLGIYLKQSLFKIILPEFRDYICAKSFHFLLGRFYLWLLSPEVICMWNSLRIFVRKERNNTLLFGRNFADFCVHLCICYGLNLLSLSITCIMILVLIFSCHVKIIFKYS